jgi:Flp pilus assembly protein CpaB
VKRSNRLLILLGLLIAITGALAAMAYVAGSGGGGGGNEAAASPSATPGPTVPVVVAATDITAGTTITAAMVKVTPMSLADIQALNLVTFSSVDQVVGKIAGADIAKDRPIVSGTDVLSAGSVVDGQSISGAIDPGMVALAIEIDQTNGVGTLIVPGDHVDIILSVYTDQLSITSKDPAGNVIAPPGGSQVSSKLILQNCKILATLLAPIAATQTAAPAANVSLPPVAPLSTVPIVQLNGRHMMAIVEVHPDDAEVIRWAQRMEKTDPQNYIDLAFALRSSQDATTDPKTLSTLSTTHGAIFSWLVTKYGVLPPDPRGIIPADIAKGIQW